jgi:predicted RNA-binding protein with RPS1 domain
MFAPSARGRLTDRDVDRFPDDTLFHRVARAVCHAGCLPRKELYETWEMARRVRRLFRGGRVIDVGAGHGLLAQIMLLLDDSSPNALVVDKMRPPSSDKLHQVLVAAWPRLSGRIAFVAAALEDIEILPTDVVVSSHACGSLTDRVLDRAVAARARVAVLPCCHDLRSGDAGGLSGWVDGPVAIDIMREALEQARAGRMHILGKMAETLGESRASVSAIAPRIVTIKIPVDKIRDVIGPGGKMIRSIIERTGVKIDVEDDGRVNVASADETSAQKAISIIQELTATPELNKTYLGKVQRITDFGAFIEIMPGTDGLLHVSEIANHRVKDVRDELKEGEQLMVKVINIDPTGKIRLSRKVLLQEEGAKPAEAAPAAKE